MLRTASSWKPYSSCLGAGGISSRSGVSMHSRQSSTQRSISEVCSTSHRGSARRALIIPFLETRAVATSSRDAKSAVPDAARNLSTPLVGTSPS